MGKWAFDSLHCFDIPNPPHRPSNHVHAPIETSRRQPSPISVRPPRPRRSDTTSLEIALRAQPDCPLPAARPTTVQGLPQRPSHVQITVRTCPASPRCKRRRECERALFRQLGAVATGTYRAYTPAGRQRVEHRHSSAQLNRLAVLTLPPRAQCQWWRLPFSACSARFD